MYKRQDPDILLTSAKTGCGLPELLAKLDDVLGHRVRTIELVPVSYTHLDVYKRQPLAWADVSGVTHGRLTRLPAEVCVFTVFFVSGFWHGRCV